MFEDDQFGYDFYQGHLNVSRVKTSGDILTVPFSTNKLRVSSFIPHHDLPKNVKQVYLGRNIVSLGDDQVVSLSERERTSKAFLSKTKTPNSQPKTAWSTPRTG